MRSLFALLLLVLPGLCLAQSLSDAERLAKWRAEFPKGDFEQFLVPYSEVEFDGNTRDLIPPIDTPVYVDARRFEGVTPMTPVLSVEINGDARAYPLAVMLWHEIVNDEIGGVPVAVTYCPLCNSGVVYRRDLGSQVIDLGNTGRIRHLDMVMYDRQTESWWQQFSGRAISGALAGTVLDPVPSVVEGLGSFIERYPDGQMLMPNDRSARPYGQSPFAGMEARRTHPRFAKWPVPDGVAHLDFVVASGGKAWPVTRLQAEGEVSEAGLTLSWRPGRASLHDTQIINEGRDMGSVEVIDSEGRPVVHDVIFAFAFSAFVPDGEWMLGR